MSFLTKVFLVLSLVFFQAIINAQIVPVGSGSYTTNFPGVDAANRNTYPGGNPNVSGVAATKPVPTNDWWSSLIKNDFVSNLFNYPQAFKTSATGIVLCYIVPSSGAGGSSQPNSDVNPIIIGVSGLNATKASVSDFSDWTVSMNWNSGGHDFNATIGLAMPFVYFTKGNGDLAKVVVNNGTASINGEVLLITASQGGSNYAVYAPAGSVWVKSGSTYTSTLNDKNYWSVAFLPANTLAVANEYKKYAFVFPTNTKADWSYNESTSVMRTDFSVSCDVKEGSDTTVLLGLLPHQWGYLASNSPQPQGYAYSSIRGEIKTLASNSFAVENKFYGILPTLPYLSNYSNGFSPALLNEKVSLLENDGLSSWTDSYNEGQMMNRLIQTARIADQMGNTEARDKMVETIKSRLEDWLTAKSGEVAFLFYYNKPWSTLIGYPAGHGQDGNINDHHFHWGYFIHAASFVEQFQPGWAGNWGPMIDMLIRDCSNPSRDDASFPFLRNFSPYAGHCWANGFATFPFGNDQESSSESMQFNSSLIHWGTITGNKAVRDLGIYLYTTEQTAIDEYWFNKNKRTLKPEYKFSMVSRIWGNGYDNQTFWTGDIAAVYGIEMYPIHGGSLYLGRDTAYVKSLWNEITTNTGILKNEANPNLWHDLMWEYLAFVDPQKGIDMYNSYPQRGLKFGVSDAQTYYWLHSMNALGRVNGSITSDYPISAVFTQNGDTTYVAHNYGSTPIIVSFSNGYKLNVPAFKMATSRDIDVSGVISSNYPQAYANGSVILMVKTAGADVTKVEFFDGNNLIGSATDEPFTYTASSLQLGIHNMYAKIYSGNLFNVTNIIRIVVGNEVPYLGSAFQIPGIIETGQYNMFEGGIGQGISYFDASPYNEGGDFRPGELVDAALDAKEGAVVGYIADGEWLDYTVNVATAGQYTMAFRYASGNSGGGGPFYLELDGEKISADITVASTSKWETWASKTITNINFTEGKHILRIVFTKAGFNLGKLTFTYQNALSFVPPVANAGKNVIVVLPESTASLNGSASTVADGKTLTYSWVEKYGPTVAVISDSALASPSVSGLVEGIYLFELTVNDGTYSDKGEVMVIVSPNAKLDPIVSVTSPANNMETTEGTEITITANASDLDGTIQKVEFFIDAEKIGEALEFPYTIKWLSVKGNHAISAKATDNDALTVSSNIVTLIVNDPPPCFGGPDNGDYTFMFSPDNTNPTVTFIPSKTSVGSTTCILFYSASASGPFPGISVKPNKPYQISATKGTSIYFYYTYTGADGFEHNTSAAKHTLVVGNCSGYVPTTIADAANSGISYYPNPVDEILTLNLPANKGLVSVSDLTGKLVQQLVVSDYTQQINLVGLKSGLYMLSYNNNGLIQHFKIIKK